MKPSSAQKPTDDEIRLLLERGYADTTPEFEARWVALKRELRQTPPRREWWNLAGPWRGWLGALGAATAAVALMFFLVRPGAGTAPGPELTPQLRELLALDAALAPAQPLLDDEIRVALLHLPTSPETRN